MGLVPYGLISKAQGLEGEVRFYPYSKDFNSLQYIKTFYIKDKNEKDYKSYSLKKYSIKGKYAILSILELYSLEHAQNLANSIVYIDTNDLPQNPEGEYYWFELIGLSVYTSKGKYIGIVKNLTERAKQGLLIIEMENKHEALIPMVDKIVKNIDLNDGKIIIDPPEGLLELN